MGFFHFDDDSYCPQTHRGNSHQQVDDLFFVIGEAVDVELLPESSDLWVFSLCPGRESIPAFQQVFERLADDRFTMGAGDLAQVL
jgi:hypothetical protein